MQAVFVRVLNLSVSAGYVILAVMAMRLVLRRAPRWAVCALWALVAFRLCCPFTLESALSLLPSRETVNESALLERDSAAPIIQSGFALIDRRANQAIAGLAPAAPIEPEAAPTAQPQRAPVPAAETPAPIINVMEALSWAWLAGTALMLLYGAGSYILLRRRLATAVRWKDELWQSENVDAPFVLGIFRPRVYLPFAMDGPAFEQVIAHERAHIRRHDQVTKLLAWLILSVYWFDPLCWAAYWLLGRDIELACDEWVIRDLDENQRKGYARALLAWGVTRPKLNACPVAFGEAGLKERIIKVMRYKKPALWAMALAVMLCAGAAVFLLTVPMAEAAGEGEPAPEPVTVTSAPYEAKAAETAAPEDESAETAAPEDRAVKALADQGIDVWQPDGPVDILHVLPRLFEPGQVQTIAETLFGGEAYEYEPDENGGDVPARWKYQPVNGVSDTVPYQQMKVRLVRDGGETIVSASSYSPSDGVPANTLYITNIAYDSTAGEAPAQEADITKEAERYLDELGLEGWSISSIGTAETADAAVTVCARPGYDGLPLIDASGLLEQYKPSADSADAYMDEHILFQFTSSGQLGELEWVDPVQITDRTEAEYLRSPEKALALIAEDEADALGPDATPEDVAAYLHDSGVVSMHLGYLRIALDTTATDVRMVPYWFFLDGNGRACRLMLAGSAEDIQAPEGWDADDEKLRDAAPQPAPERTLAICWSGRPGYDYNGTGFWAAAGDSFDMDVEDTADTPVWSSDNEDVATVDRDGVVTLLAPGDANIYVGAGDRFGVCPVHVASY